mgnify:CR=1 FL=1
MNNYTVKMIFPTCIHEYVFDKFDADELINFCYKQKDENPEGQFNSNRGGWHSPFYDFSDDNIITQTLAEGLGKSVFTSIKSDLSFNISYWIMINPPNSYNTSHTHPDAHLSGVMWIKTPKNSGDLRFNNPLEFSGFTECDSYIKEFQDNTAYYHTYDFYPEVGKILTFPASLRHEVRVNESNEDRIAVSYNIRISNSLGFLASQ